MFRCLVQFMWFRATSSYKYRLYSVSAGWRTNLFSLLACPRRRWHNHFVEKSSSRIIARTISTWRVVYESTMKRVSSEITVNNYKRDNDYSLQLNRWFLKSIGAWPEIQTNSMIKNVLINILRLICHSLIARYLLIHS